MAEKRKTKEELKEEQRVEKAWRAVDLLKCSYAEAYQMVLDDEAIDRGEKMPWDLTKEEKKASRKARTAERIVTKVGTKNTRTKVADEDKVQMMAAVSSSLEGIGAVINITNEDREMEIEYNGRKFKLTISATRVPKASQEVINAKNCTGF